MGRGVGPIILRTHATNQPPCVAPFSPTSSRRRGRGRRHRLVQYLRVYQPILNVAFSSLIGWRHKHAPCFMRNSLRQRARPATAVPTHCAELLLRVNNWQNAYHHSSIPGEDSELGTSTGFFSATMHSAQDAQGSGSSCRGKLLILNSGSSSAAQSNMLPPLLLH